MNGSSHESNGLNQGAANAPPVKVAPKWESASIAAVPHHTFSRLAGVGTHDNNNLNTTNQTRVRFPASGREALPPLKQHAFAKEHVSNELPINKPRKAPSQVEGDSGEWLRRLPPFEQQRLLRDKRRLLPRDRGVPKTNAFYSALKESSHKTLVTAPSDAVPLFPVPQDVSGGPCRTMRGKIALLNTRAFNLRPSTHLRSERASYTTTTAKHHHKGEGTPSTPLPPPMLDPTSMLQEMGYVKKSASSTPTRKVTFGAHDSDSSSADFDSSSSSEEGSEGILQARRRRQRFLFKVTFEGLEEDSSLPQAEESFPLIVEAEADGDREALPLHVSANDPLAAPSTGHVEEGNAAVHSSPTNASVDYATRASENKRNRVQRLGRGMFEHYCNYTEPSPANSLPTPSGHGGAGEKGDAADTRSDGFEVLLLGRASLTSNYRRKRIIEQQQRSQKERNEGDATRCTTPAGNTIMESEKEDANLFKGGRGIIYNRRGYKRRASRFAVNTILDKCIFSHIKGHSGEGLEDEFEYNPSRITAARPLFGNSEDDDGALEASDEEAVVEGDAFGASSSAEQIAVELINAYRKQRAELLRKHAEEEPQRATEAVEGSKLLNQIAPTPIITLSPRDRYDDAVQRHACFHGLKHAWIKRSLFEQYLSAPCPLSLTRLAINAEISSAPSKRKGMLNGKNTTPSANHRSNRAAISAAILRNMGNHAGGGYAAGMLGIVGEGKSVVDLWLSLEVMARDGGADASCGRQCGIPQADGFGVLALSAPRPISPHSSSTLAKGTDDHSPSYPPPLPWITLMHLAVLQSILCVHEVTVEGTDLGGGGLADDLLSLSPNASTTPIDAFVQRVAAAYPRLHQGAVTEWGAFLSKRVLLPLIADEKGVSGQTHERVSVNSTSASFLSRGESIRDVSEREHGSENAPRRTLGDFLAVNSRGGGGSFTKREGDAIQSKRSLRGQTVLPHLNSTGSQSESSRSAHANAVPAIRFPSAVDAITPSYTLRDLNPLVPFLMISEGPAWCGEGFGFTSLSCEVAEVGGKDKSGSAVVRIPNLHELFIVAREQWKTVDADVNEVTQPSCDVNASGGVSRACLVVEPVSPLGPIVPFDSVCAMGGVTLFEVEVFPQSFDGRSQDHHRSLPPPPASVVFPSFICAGLALHGKAVFMCSYSTKHKGILMLLATQTLQMTVEDGEAFLRGSSGASQQSNTRGTAATAAAAGRHSLASSVAYTITATEWAARLKMAMRRYCLEDFAVHPLVTVPTTEMISTAIGSLGEASQLENGNGGDEKESELVHWLASLSPSHMSSSLPLIPLLPQSSPKERLSRGHLRMNAPLSWELVLEVDSAMFRHNPNLLLSRIYERLKTMGAVSHSFKYKRRDDVRLGQMITAANQQEASTSTEQGDLDAAADNGSDDDADGIESGSRFATPFQMWGAASVGVLMAPYPIEPLLTVLRVPSEAEGGGGTSLLPSSTEVGVASLYSPSQPGFCSSASYYQWRYPTIVKRIGQIDVFARLEDDPKLKSIAAHQQETFEDGGGGEHDRIHARNSPSKVSQQRVRIGSRAITCTTRNSDAESVINAVIANHLQREGGVDTQQPDAGDTNGKRRGRCYAHNAFPSPSTLPPHIHYQAVHEPLASLFSDLSSNANKARHHLPSYPRQHDAHPTASSSVLAIGLPRVRELITVQMSGTQRHCIKVIKALALHVGGGELEPASSSFSSAANGGYCYSPHCGYVMLKEWRISRLDDGSATFETRTRASITLQSLFRGWRCRRQHNERIRFCIDGLQKYHRALAVYFEWFTKSTNALKRHMIDNTMHVLNAEVNNRRREIMQQEGREWALCVRRRLLEWQALEQRVRDRFHCDWLVDRYLAECRFSVRETIWYPMRLEALWLYRQHQVATQEVIAANTLRIDEAMAWREMVLAFKAHVKALDPTEKALRIKEAKERERELRRLKRKPLSLENALRL